MESETKTKVRELPPSFIAELDKQNFPANEFSYIDMGPVTEKGDLQRLQITATCVGWDLYNCFKEAWIIKS